MARPVRFYLHLVVAALAASLVLAPSTASAGSQETVTVGSGAKVEMKADLLKVLIGVRAQRKTASAAENSLSRKAHKVIDALEASGFRNVKTTDIHISRQTEKGKLTGYLGSLSLKIQTGDTRAAGKIIDVATKAGASSVRDVSFDVKDKRAAIEQALAEAMDFAEVKARVLAEGADRQLGRALKIVEGSTEAPRAVHLAARDFGGGGGSGGEPLPIKPPKLSASARIRVTFELI